MTNTRGRRPLRRSRRARLLAVFAASNALAAWAGALGLVSGELSFGRRLDRRLPFHSRPLAGVALALLIAVPLSTLAGAAWRGAPQTGRLSKGVGALLIGWILVQLAVLRAFSWFQPTYLGIGALLIVWGHRIDARPGPPRRRRPPLGTS